MTADNFKKDNFKKENLRTNSSPWQARLGGVTLGKPVKHGGLCVYPLIGGEEGALPYLLLEEALASGVITIKEQSAGASVPTLTLTNTSISPVLLLDGEELVGAKQNRIINTSVLAAPTSTLTLPVTCVEAGRWHQQTAQFASGGSHYNARGRQQKVAEVSASLTRSGQAWSDQSRVWSDIQGKLDRLAVPSPTRALHDISARYETDLTSYAAALSRPLPGQVGAVFALGRDLVGLDLFDQARTLTALLPKLVASYALDALEETRTEVPPPVSVVQTWLQGAALADAAAHPAVGLGEDVRLSGPKLSGAALEYGGASLHLSLFTTNASPVPPRTRLARSSQRHQA